MVSDALLSPCLPASCLVCPWSTGTLSPIPAHGFRPPLHRTSGAGARPRVGGVPGGCLGTGARGMLLKVLDMGCILPRDLGNRLAGPPQEGIREPVPW